MIKNAVLTIFLILSQFTATHGESSFAGDAEHSLHDTTAPTVILEEDEKINSIQDSLENRKVDSELFNNIDNNGDDEEQQSRKKQRTEIIHEEEEEDDRTLLDLFGERAKTYLTKNLIPDTDEECRWDWRYARCNPNCSCELRFQWGDFHLGRSCRRRAQREMTGVCNGDDEVFPNTLYTKYFAIGVQVSRILKNRIRHRSNNISLQVKRRMNTMRAQTCKDIPPLDCNSILGGSTEYQRSIPEKLFCRHVPSSCENNYELFAEDEENVSSWVDKQMSKKQEQQQQEGKRMMNLAAGADWVKYFD